MLLNIGKSFGFEVINHLVGGYFLYKCSVCE